MMSRALLSLVFLLVSSRALAQEPKLDAQRVARQHFQEGLTKAAQGDVEGALVEFQSAYASRPHFSVLYNIGQAHAALGRPIEAVRDFEQYLKKGEAQIGGDRRREVEALIEANRKRLGQLKIATTDPAETRIWLDGSELGGDSLGQPLTVVVGQHSIVYSGSSGPAQSQSVVVAPGQTLEIALSTIAPPREEVTQLAIECRVPGVRVEVNGAARGTTPFRSSLLSPPGDTTVRFARAGYSPISKSVTGRASQVVAVTCDQTPLQPVPALLLANLQVRTAPADALVLVDGKPFHGGPLVTGPHTLRVERDGFLSHERLVSVPPGRQTVQEEQLRPTAEQQARDYEAFKHRRRTGLILGGSGAVLLGTGIGIYAWNTGRYDDWTAQRNTSTASHNLDRATSIQRADDVALGLVAAGAALALGGAWLFFTTD
jgi:hypothetical protein